MLSPVLAFAGVWFKDVQYKDGSVTGSVYTSVYDDVYSVTLNVYDPNKNFIRSVLLDTYAASTVNGATYNVWTLPAMNVGVHGSVYLSYATTYKTGNVLETVTDTTYSPFTHSTTPSTPIGGGYIPPTTPGSTSIDATSGVISEANVKDALANDKEIKIKETLAIPAAALVGAKIGAILTITGDNGTYQLPVSVLKLDDLAKALGVELKDLKIHVSIAKLTGTAASAVADAVKSAGGTALSEAVDFTLVAEGKDGKKLAIDSFGSTYVKRSLKMSKPASKIATVAMFDPATKALSFVPSKVSTASAEFQRTGNSVYIVVENAVSFSDVTSHWAKSDIELLASKFVVNGTGNGKFEADRDITRAEFAALAVKALGLNVPTVVSNTYFSDVAKTDWYAGYVVAAREAGLVNGYEDGTFKAEQSISREELSALVVRALKFAGVDTAITASEQAAALAKYTDSGDIVWAKAEVAAAIELGIVRGKTSTSLDINASATRAESATMLKRLLSQAGFIE